MSNGTAPAPERSLASNLALLIQRVACALPVLYHGSGILFGVFGGPGPQGFAAYQHLPLIYGYLVGLAQFAGGLAILLGAFGRIGSVCVVIVMIGAIHRVHWSHGFDIGKGGAEFALTVLLVALSLLLSGPGSYSLGRILPGPLKRL